MGSNALSSRFKASRHCVCKLVSYLRQQEYGTQMRFRVDQDDGISDRDRWARQYLGELMLGIQRQYEQFVKDLEQTLIKMVQDTDVDGLQIVIREDTFHKIMFHPQIQMDPRLGPMFLFAFGRVRFIFSSMIDPDKAFVFDITKLTGLGLYTSLKEDQCQNQETSVGSAPLKPSKSRTKTTPQK